MQATINTISDCLSFIASAVLIIWLVIKVKQLSDSRVKLMVTGMITKSECDKIKDLDYNNLIVAFTQSKHDFGSEKYHILCYKKDIDEVKRLFDKIREF